MSASDCTLHRAVSVLFAFLLFVSESNGKDKFGDYTPQTEVLDISNIARDAECLDESLSENAKNDDLEQYSFDIYEKGGYSKPYAEVRIRKEDANVKVGDSVKGTNDDNDSVILTVWEIEEESDHAVLKLMYTVDPAINPSECAVGGLPESCQVTDGCLKESEGKIIINGDYIDYKYSLKDDNKSARTLKGFSADIGDKMDALDSDRKEDFNMFKEYYKTSTYSKEWVDAAYRGKNTSNISEMENGADWEKGADISGRASSIGIGGVALGNTMQIIYRLEKSIEECYAEKFDEAKASLDEAVALYYGSNWIDDDGGNLNYGVAQKECQLFRSCRNTMKGGLDTKGPANSNLDITEKFVKMQKWIAKSTISGCKEAEFIKADAVGYMKIPFIQGTLYSSLGAEIKSLDKVPSKISSDQLQAEGATYAAAMLPWLNDCNSDDARTVYKAMKIANTDYGGIDKHERIREALNGNWECMNVPGAKVGGIWNATTRSYGFGLGMSFSGNCCDQCNDYCEMIDGIAEITSQTTCKNHCKNEAQDDWGLCLTNKECKKLCKRQYTRDESCATTCDKVMKRAPPDGC